MNAALGRTLDDTVGAGLSARVFTAACYEVQWRGKRLAHGEQGHLAAESKYPATRSTLFDLASLTKPMAAALAVLRLIATDRLSLDTTIGELCGLLPTTRPSSSSDGRLRCHRRLQPATVRDLLTHTSGVAAWKGLYERGLSRGEFVQAILSAPPKHKPGTKYEYSCLGYIVLGEIASAVAEQPLDAFVREQLHLPAGMKDTRYCPASGDRRRAAATEFCRWRGKRARGFVHDENAFSLGGVAGNAGLFSTAEDVSRFCRALLDRRPPFDALSDRLYRAYTANQLKDLGSHSSCGWFTHDSGMLGSPPGFSRKSFGHTGYTGTKVIIDPANEGFAFLLTNRVYYGRDFERYGQLRRGFYDRVGECVSAG